MYTAQLNIHKNNLAHRVKYIVQVFNYCVSFLLVHFMFNILIYVIDAIKVLV